MDKEKWEWEERKKMDKEIWRCRTQFMKKGSAFFPSKILSFSSFFIQMQDMCQIKYPKAENKPPKKKTKFIILSTTNLPFKRTRPPTVSHSRPTTTMAIH